MTLIFLRIAEGLARRAVEDDVYQGYLIPAGSIVMTNVW